MADYAIAVSGLHCANCARNVEKELIDQGASSVFVDLANEQAFFHYPATADVNQLLTALTATGYPAKLLPQNAKGTSHLQYWLLFCVVLTAPLMLPMFYTVAFLEQAWVHWLLATPVYLFSLFYFGRSALGSLKRKSANMDVLIMIGISAAYWYSVVGIIFDLGANFLFFETASAISTFVLLGNYIERQSIKKTSAALQELASRQDVKALRIVAPDTGSEYETIAISEIQLDDILLLQEGAQIPTDGVLLSGSVSADESLLTGESAPIEKELGSTLIGGSIVSYGSGTMSATSLGANSVLAKIVALVRNAQNSRPAIQKLGDAISAIFVPAVLAISCITFFCCFFLASVSLSESLLRAIAVLVISCPCAMGLATPTAVSVALGRSARNGVLFKSSEAIENLSRITSLWFDKTGTLTTGNFSIDLKAENGFSKETLSNLLYSIELHSQHPIAQSIVRELKHEAKEIDLHDVKELKGYGMQARFEDGDTITIAAARNVALSSETSQSEGDILIKKGDVLIGSLFIHDTVRNDTVQAAELLHKEQLSLAVVSGDRETKVAEVARAIGAMQYFAEQTPEEKLALINEKAKTEIFAYVGDGINDAPALAKAPIGIALADASTIAVESAQVVITSDKLVKIPEAINLSRVTLRIIKQNLFWAFFYNVLAIPLAALGFLTPMVAAFTMAFSDVIVIGNSLRLRSMKLD